MNLKSSLALAALLSVSGCELAAAHSPDHGSADIQEINKCLMTLYSKAGDHCCDGTDAMKAEVTWDYGKDGYMVELANPQTGEKKWYKVPNSALVKNEDAGKCGVGNTLVWWSPTYEMDGSMTPSFRCLKPGGGS